MKICMLVKNSFEYDARVTREARALVAAGHEVTVVALLAGDATPAAEVTPYGARVIRVPRARLGLGRVTARLVAAAERAVVLDAAGRGVPVDPARLAAARAIQAPSTAAPGAEAPAGSSVPVPVVRRRSLARARARATLAVVAAARLVLAAARRLLAVPALAAKTRILDRRMRRAAEALRADAYHAHDLNTLGVARACARAGGARLVYDSHELATERSRMGRWARRRTTRAEGRLLPAVDALIVASPVWARILEEKHGRVPAISAAVLNAPEQQTVEPLDIRPEVGLVAGMPVVLYQGSIQEHRGIEPAIDAVASLDGVALVVVGYGHHRPVLEAEVARRRLGDRVRFYGPVPHDLLLRYTASADVGLCTIVSSSLSYHTSLPNKLFEYFLAGVPVLGSEAPEIARVLAETGAGVTVPATDPAAIAAAITGLLADPEPYRRAASAAAARYHWGAEAEVLLDVYRRLEAA